ncbi:MAG TPA: hypothetical protein VI112_06440 [Bacteroidia bacterium]|jgi:hypothetical protein
MKKSIIIRALAATLVLTAATTAVNFTTSSTVAYAASYPDGTGGVWNSQVVEFLTAHGYTGITINSIDAQGNRTCHSTNHAGFYTIVYVQNRQIVSWEDSPDNG